MEKEVDKEEVDKVTLILFGVAPRLAGIDRNDIGLPSDSLHPCPALGNGVAQKHELFGCFSCIYKTAKRDGKCQDD